MLKRGSQGEKWQGGLSLCRKGWGFEECLCLGGAAQTPLSAWESERQETRVCWSSLFSGAAAWSLVM